MIEDYEWSEKDINKCLDYYVLNVLELGKVFTPTKKLLKDIEFKTSERQVLASVNNKCLNDYETLNGLGESLLKNGWYWTFLFTKSGVYEGRHRLTALRNNKNAQDTEIFYLSMDRRKWDKELTLYLPESKKPSHVKYLGLEFYKKSGLTFKTIQRAYIQTPLLLQNVLYEWEKKYGFFPARKECYNYESYIEASKK